MKKLFSILFILFCCTVLSAAARSYRIEEVPNVQLQNRLQFTSNPDNILSPGAVRTLDTLCYSLRHRALAQVAIVAVEQIDGGDMDGFSNALFRRWGVGRSDSDNGLGILLVTGLRDVRIETGYGLEGVLPDAICRRIIENYMIPHFRNGDYDTGMIEGVRAVTAVLEGSEIDLGGNDDFQGDESLGVVAIMSIVLFVVVVLVLLAIGRKGGKGGDGSSSGMGGFLGGFLGGTMLGGRGGGFGGGSSGGGFGGGGFGGGGARGGW